MSKGNEKMVEKKEETKVEKPKQVGIKDATVEQLKAVAFDIDQNIKALQRQYNEIYNELRLRAEDGTKKDN